MKKKVIVLIAISLFVLFGAFNDRLTAAIIHALPPALSDRVILSPLLPNSIRVEILWHYDQPPSIAEKLTYSDDMEVRRSAYRRVARQKVILDRQVVRNALNENTLDGVFMLGWIGVNGTQEFMPELTKLALRPQGLKHTTTFFARQIIGGKCGVQIFDEPDAVCPAELAKARRRESDVAGDGLKNYRCFLPWWESYGKKLAAADLPAAP